MAARTKHGLAWDTIKGQWQSGVTSYRLAKSHGCSKQAIDAMAKRRGWVKGQQATDLVLPDKGQYPALAGATQASPETLALIIKGYESGAGISTVAAGAGLSPKTIRRWQDKDGSFESDCLRAQARHTQLMSDSIVNAGERDWRASAYALEHHDLTRSQYKGESMDRPKLIIQINVPREDNPGEMEILEGVTIDHNESDT
jgi:uncharacterized protein YjcR